MLEVARQPGVAFSYFMVYLGTPFTRLFDLDSSFYLGCVLLGFFIGAIGYLVRFRNESQLMARALPWIMLSTFTLMNDVLTMIGRVGYGNGQAVAPRYITFSVMLPIGLLFAVAAIYQHWSGRAASPSRVKAIAIALTACAVIGLGLNLRGSICVLDHWQAWQQARIMSKVLLEFVQVTDESKLMTDDHLTGEDFAAVRKYSAMLSKMGYLRPDPLKTGQISAIADIHATPSDRYGIFNGVVREQNGQYAACGWAVLPDKECPADAVLLTYDNGQGEPTIFDVTFPGYARTDVSQATHQESYEMSGWIEPLVPGHLPPDARTLKAWAFDLEENRAYPIAGTMERKPHP